MARIWLQLLAGSLGLLVNHSIVILRGLELYSTMRGMLLVEVVVGLVNEWNPTDLGENVEMKLVVSATTTSCHSNPQEPRNYWSSASKSTIKMAGKIVRCPSHITGWSWETIPKSSSRFSIRSRRTKFRCISLSFTNATVLTYDSIGLLSRLCMYTHLSSRSDC